MTKLSRNFGHGENFWKENRLCSRNPSQPQPYPRPGSPGGGRGPESFSYIGKEGKEVSCTREELQKFITGWFDSRITELSQHLYGPKWRDKIADDITNQVFEVMDSIGGSIQLHENQLHDLMMYISIDKWFEMQEDVLTDVFLDKLSSRRARNEKLNQAARSLEMQLEGRLKAVFQQSPTRKPSFRTDPPTSGFRSRTAPPQRGPRGRLNPPGTAPKIVRYPSKGSGRTPSGPSKPTPPPTRPGHAVPTPPSTPPPKSSPKKSLPWASRWGSRSKGPTPFKKRHPPGAKGTPSYSTPVRKPSSAPSAFPRTPSSPPPAKPFKRRTPPSGPPTSAYPTPGSAPAKVPKSWILDEFSGMQQEALEKLGDRFEEVLQFHYPDKHERPAFWFRKGSDKDEMIFELGHKKKVSKTRYTFRLSDRNKYEYCDGKKAVLAEDLMERVKKFMKRIEKPWVEERFTSKQSEVLWNISEDLDDKLKEKYPGKDINFFFEVDDAGAGGDLIFRVEYGGSSITQEYAIGTTASGKKFLMYRKGEFPRDADHLISAHIDGLVPAVDTANRIAETRKTPEAREKIKEMKKYYKAIEVELMDSDTYKFEALDKLTAYINGQSPNVKEVLADEVSNLRVSNFKYLYEFRYLDHEQRVSAKQVIIRSLSYSRDKDVVKNLMGIEKKWVKFSDYAPSFSLRRSKTKKEYVYYSSETDSLYMCKGDRGKTYKLIGKEWKESILEKGIPKLDEDDFDSYVVASNVRQYEVRKLLASDGEKRKEVIKEVMRVARFNRKEKEWVMLPHHSENAYFYSESTDTLYRHDFEEDITYKLDAAKNWVETKLEDGVGEPLHHSEYDTAFEVISNKDKKTYESKLKEYVKRRMKGNYRWIRLPFTDNDHQALYYSEKSDTVYIHDSKKMSTYKVLDDGELKHHAIEPGMPEPPTENKVDRPANDVSMSEMRDAFRDINKRNEGIDPTVLENHRKMIAEYYEKYPKDPKKNPTDIAVNKARRAGAPLSFRSLEEIVEIVNRAIRAVREERGANSHGLDRDVMRLYLDEENTLLHERSRELFDMLRRLPRIAKWAQMKPREAPFSSLEQEAIQKVSELLGPAVEKSDGDDPNKDSEVKRLLYALGGALTPAAIQKGEDCAKDAAGTIMSTIGSLFTDKNGNTFKLNYAGEDFVLEPFEPLNDEEAESHEQIVETSAGVSKAILETSHASYEQPTVIEGMKALNERVQEFIDLIGEEKGRKEIIRVLYKERMNNKSKTGYKFVFSETEPNKIVLTGASGKMGVATNDATGEVILYPVEVPPSGVKLMRIFL